MTALWVRWSYGQWVTILLATFQMDIDLLCSLPENSETLNKDHDLSSDHITINKGTSQYLFLFPFSCVFVVCMYMQVCMHVGTCECMYECVHMYVHVRPEADVRNHSPLLFRLVKWGKVSQSNPELTDEASVPSQLGLGISCLHAKAGSTGVPLWPPGI